MFSTFFRQTIDLSSSYISVSRPTEIFVSASLPGPTDRSAWICPSNLATLNGSLDAGHWNIIGNGCFYHIGGLLGSGFSDCYIRNRYNFTETLSSCGICLYFIIVVPVSSIPTITAYNHAHTNINDILKSSPYCTYHPQLKLISSRPLYDHGPIDQHDP